MTNDIEIKKLIDAAVNEAVNATVLKLKMTGLMKDNKKSAYQKTEELLKDYPAFKRSDQPYTIKLVKIIEKALENIEDDIYFEIIPMAYFEHAAREEMAEYFDTTVTTISRNKNRLINLLKVELFSDDVILEIYR